jgi:hypothetical protein
MVPFNKINGNHIVKRQYAPYELHGDTHTLFILHASFSEMMLASTLSADPVASLVVHLAESDLCSVAQDIPLFLLAYSAPETCTAAEELDNPLLVPLLSATIWSARFNGFSIVPALSVF